MELVTLMAVLAGALGLTAVARRYNLSAPLLIVVVALAVSYLPGVPRIELEPELILTLVLPPLLYSTALDSSFAQFRAASRPIIALGVVLVVVTAFVVGFVVHLVLPELPLASALVLGAVVAPPDAVTAVAIGRRLGLPRRLMTVLTGESLVNDAAALTLYKITLAAVLGAAGSIGHGFLIFLVAAVLGIAVGLVAGVLVGFIRRKLDDPLMESVFGIIVPFAVYVIAEHIHPFSADFSGSGVLAVVAAGLYLGNQSLRSGSATRVQDSSVWASLDVLLETLVFALMGLQLPFVLENMDSAAPSNGALVLAAVVVLVVTIGIRIPYVFLTGVLPHALRLFGGERTRPPLRYFTILSWTGMRGVVTLAAATGVPLVTSTGAPFPGREEIQLFAFVVAVGTLLIQGLTLPVLIRRIGIDPELEAEHDEEQEKYAREQAMHAAMRRLDDLMPEVLSKVDIPKERADRLVARLRGLVESRYQAAIAGISLNSEEREASPHAAFVRARRELLLAQREAVLACREAGDLDDDVLRKVLRELDLEELSLSATLNPRLS
ncbi:Na+/H+ antiporter [Amycolatopsis sacchari]|uniref:Monovalent cation:H+ antiporter, CPA1 family n=1 Tax=Amycolatopsis sacchari TaxID=115433 RepID=A0A1I3TRV6_9PSEU|nr:Na+/H+ antiporter [Amycolatopsis sacchari]SFJ73332.1 monovalent cation:H+ antiporter, CPA1 family [Amycolatopsis sacchari]